MGRAKARMEEAWDRGWWSPGDKYVCAECFEDYAIRDFIAAAAVRNVCDYCGSSSTDDSLAAPMDDVLGLIAEGLHTEWNDPDNEGILYDSREGGYQAPILDAREVFEALEPVFASDVVQEEVVEAFSDSRWCESRFTASARPTPSSSVGMISFSR